MAISGVSMPSTVIDYTSDNSLNLAAGTGDPFSTPSSSSSSSSSSSPADAQAMAAGMLGSLPDLSSAWAGMAGG